MDDVRIQNGAVPPSKFNLLSTGPIPSETAASLSGPVEILVSPNPVSSAPAVLEVSDPSVACISAYIYALSGHLVFPSGWLPGSRAGWDLRNSEGEH
jgi:hypothetical protein